MPLPTKDTVKIFELNADDLMVHMLSVRCAAVFPLQPEEIHSSDAQHPGWELMAVTRGGGLFTCSEHAARLVTGQAVAVPEGEGYSFLADSASICTVVRFSGEIADRLLEKTKEEGGLCFQREAGEVREAASALLCRKMTQQEEASAVVYRLLTRLYLHGAQLQEKKQQFPAVVERALSLMQEDFAQIGGISDLAEALEVSKEYLIRTFTAHVGISPGKYLTQVRVEQAKLMLHDAQVPVAAVAAAAGFSSPNYFSRVFRTATGMTPSEYVRTLMPEQRVAPEQAE